MFPATRSMLMDRATLPAHQTRWVREPTPASAHLPALDDREADLYLELVEDGPRPLHTPGAGTGPPLRRPCDDARRPSTRRWPACRRRSFGPAPRIPPWVWSERGCRQAAQERGRVG
ncbi:Wadjet anti-phage system protein JetD domain-containing protein [Dactylosporangium sp. NBC_01737]|uniref:Wadjet anti-phage system protein JetD domain-containing protein n=1 Tax=Dactylosporangium sp. NBC_01737 TaxID=2975959 RepID=UPI003FA37D50